MIKLGPRDIEHIRDAMDFLLEDLPEARATRGMDGLYEAGATLDIDSPFLVLTSPDRQQVARFDCRASYEWERLHHCDECGREEWSEHPEWECNCRPAYADGEWSGTER